MRIWIDLDNAPHVQVFKPLISALEKRGHKIFLTAQEHGQTVELLEMAKFPYSLIGRHPGGNKLKKGFGLIKRSVELIKWGKNKRIDLALSHGSRSMLFAAKGMKIPVWVMYDYEYVFDLPFRIFADLLILPEVITDERIEATGIPKEKVFKYPGIKEEIYAYDFSPDTKIIEELGLDRNKIITTVRPPATTAHYHKRKTERLFYSVLEYLLLQNNTQTILLIRTEEQKRVILSKIPHSKNLVIPKRAVNGLNLIWHSDLVISGGGTMVREAAALGVPAYSLFLGKTGAVDEYLSNIGRLTFIHSKEDICKIKLEKIQKKTPLRTNPSGGLEKLIELIDNFVIK